MPKQISLIEKYFIVKEDNGLSESMEKAYEVWFNNFFFFINFLNFCF